jgi:hypothetical protein
VARQFDGEVPVTDGVQRLQQRVKLARIAGR